MLGGLIGLGGAEFRLPVLVGIYKFRTLQAVVINLIISLVTVVFSFVFRAGVVNLDRVASHASIIFDILAGSLVGSYIGVHFATRINEHALTRIVAVSLAALSLVLIGHEFIFHARGPTFSPMLTFVLGAAAGVVIGVFSSLLGVAGGELIIPTIILLFAVDIKLAGSLSLAVSIPTIMVGIERYRRQGKLSGVRRQAPFILWMSLGSIFGALAGSYLLGYVRVSFLQVLLGLILLTSAAKLWRTHPKTVTPS